MKRLLSFHFSILSFFVLCVSFLGACSSSDGGPASPDTPHYETGACPFTPPTGVTVDCGRLTVAENRKGATPAERGSLELAAAIFRAHTPSAMSVPLIYLTGGPGEGGLDEVA